MRMLVTHIINQWTEAIVHDESNSQQKLRNVINVLLLILCRCVDMLPHMRDITAIMDFRCKPVITN